MQCHKLRNGLLVTQQAVENPSVVATAKGAQGSPGLALPLVSCNKNSLPEHQHWLNPEETIPTFPACFSLHNTKSQG